MINFSEFTGFASYWYDVNIIIFILFSLQKTSQFFCKTKWPVRAFVQKISIGQNHCFLIYFNSVWALSSA